MKEKVQQMEDKCYACIFIDYIRDNMKGTSILKVNTITNETEKCKITI